MAQGSRLETQPSTLNTQHSTLNTQHSALNTQHSAPNTQHSALNTRHSTLDTQENPIPWLSQVCFKNTESKNSCLHWERLSMISENTFAAYPSYSSSPYRHPDEPLPRPKGPAARTGLAGSQGPMTTFLYLCKLMSHHEQPPMTRLMPRPPSNMPRMERRSTCQIQPQQNPQTP